MKMLDALGVTSVPWALSANGLVGPDVVTEDILADRGPAADCCWRRLPAACARRPGRHPRDASLALAARFDLQGARDVVQAVAKADGETKPTVANKPGPGKPDDGQAAADATPPALPPDVFKSLGNRWCFYNSPKEGGMILTGLTGVVPITDRQQFSQNYEVLKRFVMQSLPADDGSNGGQRVRRFPFAGGDIHYAGMGEIGLAPAWFAGDKQLVFALRRRRASKRVFHICRTAAAWPTCRR